MLRPTALRSHCGKSVLTKFLVLGAMVCTMPAAACWSYAVYTHVNKATQPHHHFNSVPSTLSPSKHWMMHIFCELWRLRFKPKCSVWLGRIVPKMYLGYPMSNNKYNLRHVAYTIDSGFKYVQLNSPLSE